MTQKASLSLESTVCNDKTLIIQPLPGIGDALWHLRAYKAIARHAPSGKISLLANPKSQIDKLIGHEPWVEDVIWLDETKHCGPFGSLTLGQQLKQKNFASVWILHHSRRFYLASRFANIPQRYGYGFGWHKHLLTQAHPLDEKYRILHAITRFEAFFDQQNISLKPEDHFLSARPDCIETVKKRFQDHRKPSVVLGYGATNPRRIWAQESFADLAVQLDKEFQMIVFLCGAKSESDAGQAILSQIHEKGGQAVLLNDLDLSETCALIDQSALFIGNDSGLLNLAGSLNKKAIGLFGNIGVLEYDQNIFTTVLEKERSCISGGMHDISVQNVIEMVKKIS